MSKIQLEGILKLIDVDINPKVFQKISRATASLPASLGKTAKNANRLNDNMKRVAQSTRRTQQAMSGADKVARQFIQRMAQFAILLPTFATLNRAIQGGVKFLAEFETELRNILRIDIDGLRSRLDEIAMSALNIATEFGGSATQVVSTIRLFKQAGLEIEDAMEKARVATLATRVSTLSLTEASEALIAVSKQFAFAALEDVDVLDKLAKVEDEAAVGAQDIAEALRTGGNALGFASKSFDDTIGLIAGLREQSRKTGREIGTFFKTLSTRLLAAGEARNAVEELGVTVENADGSLRPLLDILLDLDNAFQGLTEAQAASAAKSVAGVRQFESLLATLASVRRAQELSEKSADAQGTAQTKLAEVNQTLAVEAQRVVAEFQKLAVAFGESGGLDVLKEGVKFAQGIAIGLQEAVKFAGELNVNLLPLLGAGAVGLGRLAFGRGFGGGAGGGGPETNANTAAVQANTNAFAQHTAAQTVNGRQMIVGTRKETGARNKNTVGLNKQTAKIAGAITAVTLFSGLLDQASGGLKETTATVGGFQLDLGRGAAELSSTLQTAATFGLLLGAKAGAVAGGLTAVVSATSSLVEAIRDETAARKDSEKLTQAATARVLFTREVAGGGDLAKGLIESIGQAFVNSEGELSGEFQKSFQNIIGEAIKDRSEFKGLDVQSLFGDPRFLQALQSAAEDFNMSLDNLEEAMSRTDSVSIRFAAAISDFGANADTSFDKLAKFFDFDRIVDDAEQIKRVVSLESNLAEIRSTVAQANMAMLGVEESTLQALQRRVEEEKRLQFVQSKAVVALQSRALGSQNALGLASGDPRQAIDLIENLREAIRTGRTEIERDGEKIEVTFQDLVTNLRDTAIAPQKFDAALKILIDEFEAGSRVAQASAEVTKRLREEQEKLQESRLKNEAEVLQIERERIQGLIDLGLAANSSGADINTLTNLTLGAYNAILDGTSNLSQNVQNAVMAFAGDDLGGISATQEKFRIEIEALEDAFAAAEQRVADLNDQMIATGEPGDFEEVLKALEDARKAENELAKVRTQAQQEVAQVTLQALREANEAQREFREELEKSSKAFKEFVDSKVADFAQANASANEELAQAEQNVLAANDDLAASFLELQASIIDFNDSMAEARVEANLIQLDIQSIGGGLNGFRERLTAIDNAFTTVLRDGNISLRQRIALERQLAEETLSFIRQAQDELTAAGLQIFGQDASANRDLQIGVDGLKAIADKLGGSFDAFLDLSPDEFGKISDELLNLPVDFRQAILDALRTLPSTTDIGGFSPEELERAIGQIGTGIAPEAGLPSVEELLVEEKAQLEKLAELTVEDAELQIAQVIAAQEQVELSKAQLEEAELLRDRAEQNLIEVRDAILEEARILEAADALRVELTERLIDANNSDTVEIIQSQAAEFAAQTGEIGAKLQGVIDAVAAVSINVINAVGGVNGAHGYIPNFSRGNLKPGEVLGLLSAARREKAQMPAGAGLAVANTTEAIIPTRARGFIPNFQGGNQSEISAGIGAVRGINETVVAAISRSVTQALAGLEQDSGSMENDRVMIDILGQIQSQLEDLNTSNTAINSTLEDQGTGSTGAAATGATGAQAQQVSIDVNINDRQTVTVAGIDDLPNAISQGVSEAALSSTQSKLNPVIEQLQSVIQGLRERGLISSFGDPQ